MVIINDYLNIGRRKPFFNPFFKCIFAPKQAMKMRKDSIHISFDGDSHQIEANTLVNTLIHYSSIIESANTIHGEGGKQIRINVNVPEKGSFLIDVSIVAIMSGLFAPRSVSYIADLIGIVAGVFSTYKHLKGKPATESDKPIIQQEINQIMIDKSINIVDSVVNIYNYPPTRQALSSAFATVSNDENVDGVTISANNVRPVNFKREEFPELIYDDFDNEDCLKEDISEIDDNALLTITSLSFENNRKWGFLYKGYNIKVNVKDGALMDIINGGERFGKGDAIRVKLAITKKFNTDFGAYENKSYKIVEFHEHIKSDIQMPKILD